jgi:hypothetical protein
MKMKQDKCENTLKNTEQPTDIKLQSSIIYIAFWGPQKKEGVHADHTIRHKIF